MSVAVEIARDGLDGAEVPIGELRGHIAELFDRVADDPGDPIVYVTRNGRRIGAIMAADTAEDYREMEDAYWAQRAAAARTERAATGEAPVAWEQAVAEIEADDA